MRKVLLTALILVAAAGASADELVERTDKTYDVRPGARFTLSNVNGRVNVTAWDQSKVRVIARREVRGSASAAKEAMSQLRIDVQQRDGGLAVRTEHPRNSEGLSSIFDWLGGSRVEASVQYDITVPRSMNVEVDNVNGAIVLNGVSGKHELETTNGKIDVVRAAGALDASTTNGKIAAELLSVAPGQPLRFSTTNGRVELSVPASLAVDLDASTTNGSISTDLPVATNRVDRNSLRGSINGGGTPLRIRTTNGSIDIRTN